MQSERDVACARVKHVVEMDNADQRVEQEFEWRVRVNFFLVFYLRR